MFSKSLRTLPKKKICLRRLGRLPPQMAMWPFAYMAPPPALESPQASRPASVQLDPPPSLPRSAGLLMNLPSSGFTKEAAPDAPPMPLSTSPTRPLPRPPIPEPEPPRRAPSERRMSIRRELPPVPALPLSITSSALLSPPRVRPDAEALADQNNGLLSPPRSRKETGMALGGARVSGREGSLDPPLRTSKPGAREFPSTALPIAPARTPSNRVSVQRALPPAPVYAMPAVATSNMIPMLPMKPIEYRSVEKPAPAAAPPAAVPAEKPWAYTAEEQALMRAVSQTAEGRVRISRRAILIDVSNVVLGQEGRGLGTAL